ncbi:hypothetical protein BDR07DRAFT_1486122 [Suillus spraguei]|nr:hypothetical protein BDR07DRAFT_1486122 [Suillus spraguei]
MVHAVFKARFGDSQVIELNPSSYIGYQLKHTVLHGAHQYDEAIEAFKITLSWEVLPTRKHKYISPSETEGIIQETIKAQLDDAPHRLINTSAGCLCSREVQISAFKMSAEYKELLSSTMKHAGLRTEHIKDVVLVEIYFRYVMLSHRWELHELLITTGHKLTQFSSPRPTIPAFLLIHPWNRYLELAYFADLSGSAELTLLTTRRARKMTSLCPDIYYRIRPMGSLRHRS